MQSGNCFRYFECQINQTKTKNIMTNKITKIATIYKVERMKNPTIFENLRSEFISAFLDSKPKMNITLNISSKPF